ncbi:MAG: hypothetical protein WKF77_29770, partial [Planctomycetaceae bacterium]
AAPELLQNDAPLPTVAVDVYGLGAILYVLITGQPPFAGRNSSDIWTKIRDSDPQPPRTLNARVHPDLEAICLRALEKNPAVRYVSAAALAEDLQRYLNGDTVVARPVGWWQSRWRLFRKHPFGSSLAVASGILVLVLLAVIAVQIRSLDEQKKQTEAARREADTFRRALEIGGEEAGLLEADLARGKRGSAKVQ